MNERLRLLFPLILFALTIGFTINNRYDDAFTSFFLMLGYIFIQFFKTDFSEEENKATTSFSTKANIGKTAYHVYHGDELNFSDDQLIAILNKRFPYFNSLSQIQKTQFINRVQNFISAKTFKIHEGKGFKEMPVLVSAAAIQLSFGLKKYLLPHFEFIHIHPQEFLRVRPVLCFLEGNVSGHAINLSWKHFMEGYLDPTDGQNVGLHELAHALYYQTFEVRDHVDKSFIDLYDEYVIDADNAFNSEKNMAGGLFSEYAEKNTQEFWAESVEIFFEKPAEMQSHYPRLYDSMKLLLNQDPVNNNPSMIR